MIFWASLVLTLTLALIHSPFWWIAISIICVLKLARMYYLKGQSWRRFHFPLMKLYLPIATVENTKATNEGREFDLKEALKGLVRRRYPLWEEERIAQLVNREFERCENQTDVDLILNHVKSIKRRKDIPSDQEYEALEADIRDLINPNKRDIMVRMTIAGIIEEEVGESQRSEYLWEVLCGNAH